MTKIGKITVGRASSSTKVIGVINVSPESFYQDSVRTSDRQIREAAEQMQKDGADIIDVGAMSTAPYLDTLISVREEIRRLVGAIKLIKQACDLPVSADTPRASAAEEAISAGADAINDVTGLKYDGGRMAIVAAKAGITIIVGAYRGSEGTTGRLSGTVSALKESVALARKAGVNESRIIVDPSIGFFRSKGNGPFFTTMNDLQWYVRDLEVLSNLKRISAALKKPVCVSVSRKSFIGQLFGLQRPEDRLVPSLICEAIAVQNGASFVRTHSVRETVQAITMLKLLS